MNSKGTLLALLVASAMILLITAAVLGADPQMKWWLIGSGGGAIQGPGNNLVSAIGQPLAGRTSNGYTLFSGLYLGDASPGPTNRYVMLPMIQKILCTGFSGPEQEDNDNPSEANGPLCSGRILSGSIYDANENAANQNTEDWFSFQWNGSGQVTIEVKSFPVKAGVYLYRDPAQPALASIANQSSGNYTISFSGTGVAGKYYVRLFVDGSLRPAGAPGYTLKVTY